MENQPAVVHAVSGSPCLEKHSQLNTQDGQLSISLPLQVRDVQESLRVLRNQIAFAQQCLGLLNNQMKHAGDTIGILQDQILKAEETISQIGIPQHCTTGKEQNSVSASAIHNFNKHVTPNQEDTDIMVIQGGPAEYICHKMGANEKQQVIFLDKDSGVNSRKRGATATMLCRQPNTSSSSEGTCSCSNCCSEVEIIEKSNTVGGSIKKTTLTCDIGRTVTHDSDKCGASQVGETSKLVTHEVTITNRNPQVAQGSQASQSQPANKDESGQSTSPMASQLLQVIDVLQSAADDEPKSGRVLTPSTPLSATSSHSSGFVYTIPPPESGIMPMASSQAPMTSYAFPKRERTPRKSRKHTVSPQISPAVKQSACSVDQFRHHADLRELMIVPQPVLASTLEPEFIVVPSSGAAPSPGPHPPEGEAVCPLESHRRGSSSDRDDSTKSTPSAEVKQEPPDSPKCPSTAPGSVSSETVTAAAMSVSTKSDQNSLTVRPDEISSQIATAKTRKQKLHERASFAPKPNTTPTITRSSLLNQPFTALQSQSTTTVIRTTESSIPSSYGSILVTSKSSSATNGISPGTPPLAATTGDGQALSSDSNPAVTVLKNASMAASGAQTPLLAVSEVVQTQEQNTATLSTGDSSQVTEVVAQPLTSVPFVVTNSVAQTKTTSSPRRPNILSRKRDKTDQRNSMPEGLVVLVPTIEDAKKLISSTGRQGRTPVLVPEHLAQNFQNSSQEAKATQDNTNVTATPVSSPNKRIHQSPLNTPEPSTKRRNIESVILE